jgi:enamine deaminase RidA (YjgF/YER057c/UK114 family)
VAALPTAVSKLSNPADVLAPHAAYCATPLPPTSTLISIAGRVSIDHNDSNAPSFAEQIDAAMSNFGECLALVGATPEYIVEVTRYVVDLRPAQSTEVEKYMKFMDGHKLPSTLERVAKIAVLSGRRRPGRDHTLHAALLRADIGSNLFSPSTTLLSITICIIIIVQPLNYFSSIMTSPCCLAQILRSIRLLAGSWQRLMAAYEAAWRIFVYKRTMELVFRRPNCSTSRCAPSYCALNPNGSQTAEA